MSGILRSLLSTSGGIPEDGWVPLRVVAICQRAGETGNYDMLARNTSRSSGDVLQPGWEGNRLLVYDAESGELIRRLRVPDPRALHFEVVLRVAVVQAGYQEPKLRSAEESLYWASWVFVVMTLLKAVGFA